MRALPLLAIVLAVPFATSSGEYHREGELTPTLPGFTPVDDLILSLSAGQTVTMEVALDDPDAIVNLGLVTPGMQCMNTGCAVALPLYLSCSYYVSAGSPFEPGHLRVEYLAPETGNYEMRVGADLADDLGYVLDITMPAADVTYDGPNGVGPGTPTVCRAMSWLG